MSVPPAGRTDSGVDAAVEKVGAGDRVELASDDLVVELPERRRGLDAELVAHGAPVALVHGEGVGPPPGAGQRPQQQEVGPLVERLVRRHRLQVGDHLGVAPEVEEGVGPLLGGPLADLAEAERLDAGVVDVAQLLVGGAAPPGQDVVEPRHRGRRVLGSPAAGVVHGRLEPHGVDLLRLEAEPVAGGIALDGAVGQELPEPEHVGLEGGLVVGRQPVGPQEVRQLVDGRHLAPTEGQRGEEPSLERAAGRDVGAGAPEHHPPQHLDVHRVGHPRLHHRSPVRRGRRAADRTGVTGREPPASGLGEVGPMRTTDPRITVADLGDIVTVWAHPDDESYLAAGLMAMAVDAGSRVTCVTATAGERGGPADLEAELSLAPPGGAPAGARRRSASTTRCCSATPTAGAPGPTARPPPISSRRSSGIVDPTRS